MEKAFKPFTRRWTDMDENRVLSYSPTLSRVRNGRCTYPLTTHEVLDLGLAYDAQSLHRAMAVYHGAAQRYCQRLHEVHAVADMQPTKFTRAFTHEEAETPRSLALIKQTCKENRTTLAGELLFLQRVLAVSRKNLYTLDWRGGEERAAAINDQLTSDILRMQHEVRIITACLQERAS